MRSHASALVLEDNSHMRYLLSQMLHGIEVEQVDAVSSITEARQHMSLLSYDFALIDVGLDGENGLDLIRAIRRNPKHPARRMPMIVVSGQNQMSVIGQARDAGADSFLSKPVSMAALQSRVVQVLDKPRLYVESANYFGPDRRRGASPNYSGPERRRAADFYV